jgi:predicted metalloprotease with PDZ domain
VSGVAYRLSMPSPHTHLFEVEVRASCIGEAVELVMPSWTPGSYLLREFARNVQDFEARSADGAPLAWAKTDKGTWRVERAGAGAEVVARYRVYANELTVRTSHLDASHGYVNGASVLAFVRGREGEPHTLEVEAPAGWRTTTTLRETGPGRFRAADYDELVDSPLEIGTHEVVEWEQEGVPHRYAIWGRGNHDTARLVSDTRRIVRATSRLFGGLPYDRYLFLLHLLPEGRGGLEHASSCSLQVGRWSFAPADAEGGRLGEEYEQVLALVAHEFLHVWNAKRIRPAPLGPFDYTRENYTRNLWVVEGLTTYYTDLVLRRAGLISADRYLARLGESIARHEALPGRRHQSLADSSFDTWIKFYRPDPNTPNSQVSYYQKGALVGLLLDMEIRRRTGNTRSLDDLMRLLWERYGRPDVGFPEPTEEGIRRLAEEVAGGSLVEFFEAYVHGTAELGFDRYLAAAGLRVRRSAAKAAGGDPGAGEPLAGTAAAPTRIADAAAQETRLGVRTQEAGGRLRVTHVLAGTPAYEAGLNAGDEILALDGFRVGQAELRKRLAEREAGEQVDLALFRRDELMTLQLRLAHPAPPRVQVVQVPEPSAEQRAVYRGWLGVEVGGGDVEEAGASGAGVGGGPGTGTAP